MRKPLEPAPLVGRDEMNLAEFPIALLADLAPKGQKTLYFEDGNGRLTVTGSDAYGLPTAADADVIVALIYLTKLRNDFQDVKVNFSRYELIKLLNWPDKGKSYKRLDQPSTAGAASGWSMTNAGGTTRPSDTSAPRCTSWKASITAEPGENPRRAMATCRSPPSPGTRPSSKAARPTICANSTSTNISRLKSAVSKRLYRFLGKRFYLQGEWTFDLQRDRLRPRGPEP